MVIVEDNFFKADLSNLIAKGADSYLWRYHHQSVTDPAANKFFVSNLWSHSAEENFFRTVLWNLIQKRVPYVADCDCWRIIANGQVKGQNGNWHKDHGDRTVLYLPMQWVPEWGGSTYFMINDSETEIQYKQNRLIVFDSQIRHYGSAPAIDNILRVSIAFNLRVKATDPDLGEGNVVR
jgi:hypothetical protein